MVHFVLINAEISDWTAKTGCVYAEKGQSDVVVEMYQGFIMSLIKAEDF